MKNSILNSKKPLVAVITRTQNRSFMLRRAIRSVANQTLKDYVHVIVNDAGDIKEVNKAVSELDTEARSRIEVIDNPVSHGMEAASNLGIKSSNSLYIAIHDDDDSWDKDFLKMSTERLQKNKMLGVVVHTEQVIESIQEDNTIKKISSTRFNPEIREINFYDMFKRNYATPITFLYERSVFDKIGYYDEGLPVCGDWDFALRFIRHWDIDYLDSEKPLAFYHLRPDATGVNGNSVISGFDKHRYYTNYLANKYLREDLDNGSLGMGYMFNLRRNQNFESVELHAQHDVDKADVFEWVTSVSERVNMLVEKVDYIQESVESISEHVHERRNSLSYRVSREISRTFNRNSKKP